MANQILDRRTIAIPGGKGETGDVTPEAEAARDAAQAAQVGAETAQAGAEDARDQAETFAAGAVALQDGAVSSLISDSPATQTQAALALATATQQAMLKPGINLDIWPGMDPIPSTYAAWISGVDAELAGAATKTVVGQDSYGADIHLYDGGEGKHTVLLVGGQHPWEILGPVAARQFFVQFATSDHPTMVVLRKQIRLLWLPVVVAGGYRGGRENANGVNVNRNYPWNWGRASEAKGAAPLDQPEAQVIKSVIDTYPVSLLFDCHNYGSTAAQDFSYATAPNAIQGKQSTMEKAHSAWVSANPDAPVAVNYNDANFISPVLVGWAQKYMRFDLGRINAMTVLFECIATLGGSDSNGNIMTRKGVRWYASFIYQTILTWLGSGQVDEPVPPFTWLATHNLSSGGFDIPIEQGGRRVENGEWKALQFYYVDKGGNTDRLLVPVRHPGRYEITASIRFESQTAASVGDAQLEAGVSFSPPTQAATGPAANSIATGTAKSPGGRTTLTFTWTVDISDVPDEALWEAQLWLRARWTDRPMTINSGAGVYLNVKPYWQAEFPNYQPYAPSS